MGNTQVKPSKYLHEDADVCCLCQKQVKKQTKKNKKRAADLN